MAVAVQVDVSLLRLFELMEKRNVYTKEFALLIWNFKYHLSALMILHAWGGGTPLYGLYRDILLDRV